MHRFQMSFNIECDDPDTTLEMIEALRKIVKAFDREPFTVEAKFLVDGKLNQFFVRPDNIEHIAKVLG